MTGIQFGPKNTSLPLWALNDCDGVHRSEFSYMGLSLRTDRWRFTRWYPWDGKALAPVWSASSTYRSKQSASLQTYVWVDVDRLLVCDASC